MAAIDGKIYLLFNGNAAMVYFDRATVYDGMTGDVIRYNWRNATRFTIEK